MKKYLKVSLFLLSLIAIVVPFHTLSALGVSAPTILKFENGKITGLAHANSEVMIYVDGTYEGNADMGETKTETNSFSYELRKDLEAGEHKIEAIAKDRTSLVLSIFSQPLYFFIKNVPAPTMIQPNEKTITERVKPFITGLTQSGTKVYFFIDGKLNGQTDFLSHESGTANFAYRPFLNLSPGAHTAWTVAENKMGRKSSPSNVLYFNIEKPLPTAKLFAPVVNKHTNIYQPFIVGLAKNDLKIKVFIDHRLDGEFNVKNDVSGTANFAYRPFIPLKPGKHFVYATTLDSRGKESRWSNIVYFTVPGKKEVKTGDLSLNQDATKQGNNEAKKQENKQTQKQESKKVIKQEDNEAKKQESDEVKKETKIKEEIQIDKEAEEIIVHEENENNEESGVVNESKEKQTALKTNLIIFLAFLLAIIVWIFWVNRELIKEKREEENKNTEESKDKK